MVRMKGESEKAVLGISTAFDRLGSGATRDGGLQIEENVLGGSGDVRDVFDFRNALADEKPVKSPKGESRGDLRISGADSKPSPAL